MNKYKEFMVGTMFLCFVGVIYSACSSSDKNYDNKKPVRPDYLIKVIDQCQYIEVSGVFNSKLVYSLTHKGNCNNPIHKYNESN